MSVFRAAAAAVLVLAAGALSACAVDTVGVPWALSAIGRDGRELRLTAFRTSVCDEPGGVEVDESEHEVQIEVRVRRSHEPCSLVLPGPRTLAVVLDAPLGDRELVHADADPADVGSPGMLPRLQRREQALLRSR